MPPASMVLLVPVSVSPFDAMNAMCVSSPLVHHAASPFPYVAGHDTIAPGCRPVTSSDLCWCYPQYRWRVEHGVRGSSGADYRTPPTPGPGLVWCLEAAV